MDQNKNSDEILAEAQKAYREDPNLANKGRLHDAQADYVNDKLSSSLLKELEKKGDWQGLLAIYEKLLSVFPESGKLKHLLAHVHQKITATEAKQRDLYYKNAREAIEDMVLKGQLDDAQQACYEMLALDRDNSGFIHLLARIQHLQDKEMDKLLTLYFKESTPKLQAEYRAHKDQFIRV